MFFWQLRHLWRRFRTALLGASWYQRPNSVSQIQWKLPPGWVIVGYGDRAGMDALHDTIMQTLHVDVPTLNYPREGRAVALCDLHHCILNPFGSAQALGRCEVATLRVRWRLGPHNSAPERCKSWSTLGYSDRGMMHCVVFRVGSRRWLHNRRGIAFPVRSPPRQHAPSSLSRFRGRKMRF